MTYTYDLSDDIGKVRVLIPDRVESEALFTDEEITAILSMEVGLKRAVALCLETLASDNALVLKVIKVQNIQTDGASVARALLARAAQLRSQADNDESDAEASFDIAEFVVNDFSYRERLLSQFQRE